MKIKIFYEWEKNCYEYREFDFETVESNKKEQCKKCWFRINFLHCPNVPCGAQAREDKKDIYFRVKNDKKVKKIKSNKKN